MISGKKRKVSKNLSTEELEIKSSAAKKTTKKRSLKKTLTKTVKKPATKSTKNVNEVDLDAVMSKITKHFSKKKKSYSLNDVLLYANKTYALDDKCTVEFISRIKTSGLFSSSEIAEEMSIPDETNNIISDDIKKQKKKKTSLKEKKLKKDNLIFNLEDDDQLYEFISEGDIDELDEDVHDAMLEEDKIDPPIDGIKMSRYNAVDKMSNDIKVNDSIRFYLNSLGNQPLLNKEEEIALIKKIHHPNKLIAQRAMDKLVIRNLRWVINNAKRYEKQGLTLLDLIQEGTLGLMKGIRKFDPELGWRLSTYVTCWIIQAMTRALADQSRIIRIPVHMVEVVNKLYKSELELSQKLNREPTSDEINDYIGNTKSIDAKKIRLVKNVNIRPISLEKPINGDNNTYFSDFIPDTNVVGPEEKATNYMLNKELDYLLKEYLTPREEQILRMRNGLPPYNQVYKLKEVGEIFHLTRERIRQIDYIGKQKIKNSAGAQKLKLFMKD